MNYAHKHRDLLNLCADIASKSADKITVKVCESHVEAKERGLRIGDSYIVKIKSVVATPR